MQLEDPRELHEHPTGLENLTLSFHAGIGYGDGVICQLGDAKRRELLLRGTSILQAAQSEKHAGAGMVVTSRSCFDEIQAGMDGFRGQPIGEGGEFISLDNVPDGSTVKSDRATISDPKYSQLDLQWAASFLPHTLLDRIKRDMPMCELRHLTIAFAFVVGSECDLDSLSQLACTAQRLGRQHGGEMNKISLDDKGYNMLVVFGMPPDDLAADTPSRAISTFWEILRATPLKINVGIATGLAYCGICGGTRRQEFTVLGNPVNFAARLAGAGQAMGADILVDKVTRDLARLADVCWFINTP